VIGAASPLPTSYGAWGSAVSCPATVDFAVV